MRLHTILLIAAFWAAGAQAGQQLQMMLQQELEAGAISRAEYLAFQLIAAEDPAQLPPRYRGAGHDHLHCSSLFSAEARALLPALAAEERNLLAPLLARPAIGRLPLSVVSPAGHFRIHYAETGSDSAASDFVAEACLSFDYVYDLLVNEMGFSPPPADGGIDGPELDIYIMRFSAYGETRYENPVEGSDSQRYTSYIVIDNRFTGSGFETKGIDALHVTAAHEFFHMLQGAYRFFPSTRMDSRFLFEASSTWFEDVAYSEVNDYFQYVRSLFASPNRPFHLFSSMTYGLGLYMTMLHKSHGYALIRRMWEELRDQEPLDALDRALRSEGNDLGRSLATFTVWNAFTAGFADSVLYYPDSPGFPEITPIEQIALTGEQAILNECSELETHYYKITVAAGGSYTITPVLDHAAQWLYTLVIHEPGYPSRHFTIAGETPLTFGPLAMECELRLAVVNIQWPSAGSPQHNATYSFRFSPRASSEQHEDGVVMISPSPFRPEKDERMQIHFYSREPVSEAALLILTERGEVVYSRTMRNLPRGLNCQFWDGRDSSGRPLPSGIYLFAIRGTGQFKPHKMALVR